MRDTSEITGVGVLPAYRGQGLGAALSFVLARDALDLGATTVFCSAEDDEVARIYARVGFQPGRDGLHGHRIAQD